jgi:tetratricopeptide (TPR) repeat protein
MSKRRTSTGGKRRVPARSPPVTRGGGRRRKWAIATAALLVVVLAGVLGTIYVRRERRPERENLTPLARGTSGTETLPPEQEIALLKERQMALAERVLKDLPASGDACVLMGDLQRRLGRSAQAVEFWQKGLERASDRVEVYHNLGVVAAEKGESEQAISFWRQALKLDPQRPGIRRIIGRALLDLGRSAEATGELQEEIRISPQSAESHYLLGEAFRQQQNYEPAKTCFEKAVALQPKNANAHYGLSMVCAKLGQLDQAEQHRATFTQLRAGMMQDRGYGHSPADDLARMRGSMARLAAEAARLYEKAGRTAVAEELLRQATAVEPNDPAPAKWLAAFYQSSGRFPEALAQCERIARLEPNDPTCHLLLGTLALQLRQMDRAEAAFRRLIVLSPNESVGYRELARLYVNTGNRLAEARRLASKAVELEPLADNYFVLGLACQSGGDQQAAVAALRRAVELAPANPQYRQTYDIVKNRQ